MAPSLLEEPVGLQLAPGFEALDHMDQESRVLPNAETPSRAVLRPVQITVELCPLSEMDNPVPNLIRFGALRDPQLRLTKAIPLHVSKQEGTIIVSWEETAEFGTGNSLSEAIEDFSRGLSEMYHHLSADDVSLGPDLIRVQTCLREYIQLRK